MQAFHGSFTALITPFKEGEVDFNTFEQLVERQIKAGSHGLVPCGTTGESPTLNHEEHREVIKRCIAVANGKTLVMAGTGSNSTREAVTMSQLAEKDGADALLIMTPYYNKPTQQGLFEHFKTIHDATNLPIFLYNIPGRSIVDLEDDTIIQLCDLPRIAGVKDATGDMARPQRLQRALKAAGLPEDRLVQLCGEDGMALSFNMAGGVGCISVTANLVPDKLARMHNLYAEHKVEDARDIQLPLMPLHDVLFCETNPIPIKYAMHLAGLCKADMRLPMCLPNHENRQNIHHILEDFGLLS